MMKGAFEIELARRLRSFGEKTPGLSQYAIMKFAEALEVVPATLAENAGMDSTEVVSKMYAAHEAGKSTYGVDIEVCFLVYMINFQERRQWIALCG